MQRRGVLVRHGRPHTHHNDENGRPRKQQDPTQPQRNALADLGGEGGFVLESEVVVSDGVLDGGHDAAKHYEGREGPRLGVVVCDHSREHTQTLCDPICEQFLAEAIRRRPDEGHTGRPQPPRQATYPRVRQLQQLAKAITSECLDNEPRQQEHEPCGNAAQQTCLRRAQSERNLCGCRSRKALAECNHLGEHAHRYPLATLDKLLLVDAEVGHRSPEGHEAEIAKPCEDPTPALMTALLIFPGLGLVVLVLVYLEAGLVVLGLVIGVAPPLRCGDLLDLPDLRRGRAVGPHLQRARVLPLRLHR
mmetsp:Transcript_9913/g.24098  ORF Transcript_9913/g.24098 Transcript_9913/m.24098 type:complete len:305 (-) Transcript_9913:103-1017(-)